MTGDFNGFEIVISMIKDWALASAFPTIHGEPVGATKELPHHMVVHSLVLLLVVDSDQLRMAIYYPCGNNIGTNSG